MSIKLEPSKSYPGRTSLLHKHSEQSNMQTRLELTSEDVAELVQALTAAGHIKPEPKVEDDEELTVYGYTVVDSIGHVIPSFKGSTQQEAIDRAAQLTQDAKNLGVDWDYRVAAIVDQGGL